MAKKKKAAKKKPLKVSKPKKKAAPAKAAKKPKSWKSDRAKRAVANVPRTPRDRALPGMEDARIEALENIGAMYADIRDQRVALTNEEVSLKQQAMKLMHKHGKAVYRSKTIEIALIEQEESIKVKVRKDAGDQSAPQTDSQPRGEANDEEPGEGADEGTEAPEEAEER